MPRTPGLRELEASGLIERYTLDSIPPAVGFGVSPLGRLMIQPIEMIYEWARQNSTALGQLQPRSTSRRRQHYPI
ncbi:winged helix-turn-helix transcriptional regulator [Stutzerimonas sp. VN223-3]|uniref:winged helix-turn-helix transcriptional regulator n=1 Tax=Stutzerimonas sp. VN223-3 TaxID=3384601 RepID=UPI0038B58B37